MTSLELAFEEDFENSPPSSTLIKKDKQKEQIQYQQHIDNLPSNQSQQQSYQHQQIQQQQQLQPQLQPQIKSNEKFTNYYNLQELPQQQNQQPQKIYQYSFWDRMIMSKREVIKLFILSIVIILGISLEKIGCHYINNYLSSNDLTFLQELLVRFSFPIVIFIILWIIKSL